MRAAADSERWQPKQTHPGRLVGHAIEADQPQDALQVCEPHLDLLALAPRLLKALGASERSGDVSGMLMDIARNLARRFIWAALRFEGAYIAVKFACTIQKRLALVHGAARPEPLSARAMVDVAGRIISKVAAREGAIIPLRFVEHRNMWRDAFLFDQSVQIRSCPVSGIPDKPFRLEAEALLCSLDHGPCRADLGLANGAGGFDIKTPNFTSMNSCRSKQRMPGPCALRSTALQDRTARQTSGQHRWRRPTPYRPGSPGTPSPRGLTSPGHDPCASPDPRSSAACWRRPQSGSHRLQSLRHQPDRPQCTPRRHAQT